MPEYTYPTNNATHFDRFLSGLVADAVDELATPLDQFLASIVSEASDALAIDDAATARTTAPVYHVNPAIPGHDADEPAILDALDAWRQMPEGMQGWAESGAYRALRTGRIGGKTTATIDPPEVAPEQLFVGYDIGGESLQSPLCRNAQKVYPGPGPRTRDYRCSDGYKVKQRPRSDGQQVKTPFTCTDCAACLAWWQHGKRHRYEWAMSGRPAQTMVAVYGLPDDTAAAAEVRAIGRAGDGGRAVGVVQNPETYLWDAVVIFADAQAPNVCRNITRTRARQGLVCTVETGLVTGEDVATYWLPSSKRTPGGYAPFRFVGLGKAATVEPEYQYGDGIIVEDYDVSPDIPFESMAPIDEEIQVYVYSPTDTDASAYGQETGA